MYANGLTSHHDARSNDDDDENDTQYPCSFSRPMLLHTKEHARERADSVQNSIRTRSSSRVVVCSSCGNIKGGVNHHLSPSPPPRPPPLSPRIVPQPQLMLPTLQTKINARTRSHASALSFARECSRVLRKLKPRLEYSNHSSKESDRRETDEAESCRGCRGVEWL